MKGDSSVMVVGGVSYSEFDLGAIVFHKLE